MRRLTCLLLSVPSFWICPSAQAQAEAPSRFELPAEQRQGAPLWISAAAVVDPEKAVNLEILDDLHLQRMVEKQRQALGGQIATPEGEPQVRAIPRSECGNMSGLEDDRGGWAPESSLPEIAANSASILHGVIRQVTPGFYKGIPDSLLTVEVREVVKGVAPSHTIHIDYQVAHFRIGPYRFCNALSGYEPKPGDSLVLLDYTGPVGQSEAGALFAPRLSQILFESTEGGLFFRPEIKQIPTLASAKTLDEVVAQIRRELEGSSR